MRGKGLAANRVNLGFLAFAVLFVVAFVSGEYFACLVIVFVFAAIFAVSYYAYMENPQRRSESERIVRAWREGWERRWEERPSQVQDADYYLRRASGSYLYFIVAPLAVALIVLLMWLLSAMGV